MVKPDETKWGISAFCGYNYIQKTMSTGKFINNCYILYIIDVTKNQQQYLSVFNSNVTKNIMFVATCVLFILTICNPGLLSIYLLWVIFSRSSVTRWDTFLIFVFGCVVAHFLHSLHLGVFPSVQFQMLHFTDMRTHPPVYTGASHTDEDTNIV